MPMHLSVNLSSALMITSLFICLSILLAVNILTIIDTNTRLYSSFHKQIAEVDVSVFFKAVITEALQRSRNVDNS